MTEHDRPAFDRDVELRALLRSADPADSLPPADPSRVARLLEDTMSDDPHTAPQTRVSGARGRSRLTWAVAAAAAVVIAGVGIFAATGPHEGDDAGPSAGGPVAEQSDLTLTELTASPATGKCAIPDAETLAGFSLAFAGTVTSIDDDVVTLEPTRFYAGAETDTVTVQAPSAEFSELLSAVDFEVGGDYLVSASDGQVSLCGFSGPARPRLESLYEQAFAG